MKAEDCVNLILSHICPFSIDGEDKVGSVYTFRLEAHCHNVEIRARLTHMDPTHPDKAHRFTYDVVSLVVE